MEIKDGEKFNYLAALIDSLPYGTPALCWCGRMGRVIDDPTLFERERIESKTVMCDACEKQAYDDL